MRKLYPLLLLLLSSQVLAQNLTVLGIEDLGCTGWDGVDKHIMTTDDGGFIIKITSETYGSTLGNIPNCNNGIDGFQSLFRKYDADGTTVGWEKCYRPIVQTTDTFVHFLLPATNGNFYSIRSYGSSDPWNWQGGKYFINLEDNNQNTIWSGPAYGDAPELYLNSVCRSSDNGFFLAFSSRYAGGDVPSHYGTNSTSDMWVVKFDSAGFQQWNKVVGGSGDDRPFKVIQAADGGCFVAGVSASTDYDCIGSNGGEDAYVVRLDSIGGVIWHKNLGSSTDDRANDIIDGGNGILHVAGTVSGNGNFVTNFHGVSDIYYIKMDTSGNVLANNCFGGYRSEGAYAMSLSIDGNIWMTGFSYFKDGQVDTGYNGNLFPTSDCWTVKLDVNGDFESGKVLGTWETPNGENGKAIHALPNGSLFICGEYWDASMPGVDFLTTSYGEQDVFTARFDASMTSVSQNTLEGGLSKVYPNPATDDLHIKSDKLTFSAVSVTDGLGREVIRQSLAGKETVLDIKNLVSGVYFIILEGESGRETRRFVKH